MSDVDLAIYIDKLQWEVINDYENGYFPKGIINNLIMLRSKAALEEKGKSTI